ncbi:MAG: hypothetical protein FI695_03085 [SAR202 cluster bacterium]|nr:hypothetical protein [Chloroflexota bacterium]MQG50944.1 hypothetical protein [SAR202 cluster bacterium]|tara:strand:- start:6882 stop:7094 length:213 start_codon:yes stop_codon:yes gene_type:complete
MHKWEKYWIASGIITMIGFLLVYFYPSLAEPIGLVLVWLVGLLGLFTLISFIIFLLIRFKQLKKTKTKNG